MRKIKIIISAIFILSCTYITAQESLLVNVYNRASTSLNGEWNYIVDPYENGFYNYRLEPFENQENPGNGAFFINAKPKDKSDLVEYDFDKTETIKVPSDWNTQKENLYYYEGTVWYKKSFNYLKTKSTNRVFVYFGAINYESHVYLNGEKLGTNIGGFTPFNFEITDLLKEKDNFLVVKVDNKRKKEGVPTLNTDWWNYGGITRSVELIETSSNFIQDYFIQLDPTDKNKIKGFVSLNGVEIANKKIQLSIPQLKINKELSTDENGTIQFEITNKKFNLRLKYSIQKGSNDGFKE